MSKKEFFSIQQFCRYFCIRLICFYLLYYLNEKYSSGVYPFCMEKFHSQAFLRELIAWKLRYVLEQRLTCNVYLFCRYDINSRLRRSQFYPLVSFHLIYVKIELHISVYRTFFAHFCKYYIYVSFSTSFFLFLVIYEPM